MGTDLFKHYSAEKTFAFKCGFNEEWSVYNAEHKERKQQVSIFVLEKKNFKKISKNYKELLNIYKKTTNTLSKFKHPSILSVFEPLKEDQNCIAYVTDRVSYTLNTWLNEIKPSKLEVKSLVIELCKAIIFLHDDAHCIHNNLSLESIFITNENKVKLGMFEFSINDPSISGEKITINNILQNLCFMSPEIILENKCYYTSDIYTIGLIIFNLLKYIKNETVRNFINILRSNNTIENYKLFYSKIDNEYSRLNFEIEDNELIRKCLIKEPNNRPNIKELIDNKWFNDPKLKALNFIEHLELNDRDKNAEFLKQLPRILSIFENKIIIKRFLPSLLRALKVEYLIVPSLPAIFSIAEKEELKINFEEVIWPDLKNLFNLKSMPAQCLYFLLQKIKFIADKISNKEFSQNFLKIITKALDCNVTKIQSVVAENVDTITKKIDSLSFKTQIYPRIINVLQTTNSQALKIQLLTCLKDLYKLLDQNTINENLLNNLDKVRKGDNSGEICMLIANIYEEIAKVVTTLSIANKILPNLISILVSGNISKGNFDTLMQLVHKYLDKIKKDREKDLYDDKYKNKNQIVEELGENESKENKMFNDMLNNINNSSSNVINNNKTGDFLSDFFTDQSGFGNLNNMNNNNNNNNLSNNNAFDFNISNNNNNNNFNLNNTNNNNNNFNLNNTNNNNNNLGTFDFGGNINLSSNNNNINNMNFDLAPKTQFNNNNNNLSNNTGIGNNIDFGFSLADKKPTSSTNVNNNLNFVNNNINYTKSNSNSNINPLNFSTGSTSTYNKSNTGFQNMNIGNNNNGFKPMNVGNVTLDNLLNDLPSSNNNNNNFMGNNNLNNNNFMNNNINNNNVGGFNQNNLDFLGGSNNNNNQINFDFNTKPNNNNNNFDFNFTTTNNNNNNNNNNNPFNFL